ncbi:MAG: iron uptake porin [Pleurocapsa sp.]
MPKLLSLLGAIAPVCAFFLWWSGKIEASALPATVTTNLEVQKIAQYMPRNRHHQENDDASLLGLIEEYQQEGFISQENSVEQLRDVAPTDWAYEALRRLKERYGCIAGFSDGTYRGNHTVSRYEFAAGLNSCLNKIERLIAQSELVSQEDIDLLLRLMQEFQSDLAILRGRTDGLRARIDDLDVTQFSTTSKLTGEAIVAAAGILAGDEDDNPILGHRLRLQLATSFNGDDLLFTRLSSGNFPTFTETTGTFAGDLAFTAPENNNLNLEVLSYTFQLGSNTNIIIGATGVAADDFADTVNLLDGDGGLGAISRFGTRNPIYLPPGDTGLAIVHRPLSRLEISAGYLAASGDNPTSGNGLFNGPYSALGQISFAPTESLNFAATYVHSYNQSNTETGSNLANLQSLVEGISTVSNSYGVELSWAVSDRLTIGGWGTLSKVTNLSTISPISDRGTQNIWNWAATLALTDLGKEGNIAGVVVGMEPFVANSSIASLEEDRDSSLHLEAFYQYQVNDHISITPGVVWITAPDNKNDNDDLVIGTVRTTFSF